MLTKDQARQIFILASNYANYEAAAESAEQSGYHNNAKKMADKSTKTWFKLKELVDSIVEV